MGPPTFHQFEQIAHKVSFEVRSNHPKMGIDPYLTVHKTLDHAVGLKEAIKYEGYSARVVMVVSTKTEYEI